MKSTIIQRGRCFRAAPRLALFAALAAVFLCGSIQAQNATEARATAETLVGFPGLRPGLCVSVDAADGELLAELAIAGQYHVHGLTSDRESLEKTRRYVASRGLYGQVVVDHSPLTHLPYAGNLINVLVVEDFAAARKNGLTLNEIMRVVAPMSSALLGNAPADLKQSLNQAGYEGAVTNRKGAWTQVIRPWPEGMDEWPQRDHDAGCSSISNDRLVQPSNSVQWIAGYAARHDTGPNPVLTAGGRIFSSYSDLGIVARDAFNGSKLWQREGARALIATEDKLFARLENIGPLVALDARTGATIREYSFGGASKPWPPLSRLAYHDGVMLTGVRELIEAYDAESGEQLWRKQIPGERGAGGGKLDLFQDINKKRIIGEGKVFLTLTETKEFLCLDLKTGEEIWRVSTEGDRLVCYRQGVLLSQYSGKGTNQEEVVFNAAYSAKDGTFLWRHDYRKVWHGGTPHDVFLLNGLVWVLTSVPVDGVPYGKEPQAWHGLDPKTGEVVRRADWPNTKRRCFGDRATERYIIAGGIDFLDTETGEQHKFLGGRGSCSFGRMPANGLVYQAPNTCQCYSQVRGFVAFSSDASSTDGEDGPQGQPLRLTGMGKAADETPSAEDWPMLRHDPARNGSTATALPAELKPTWEQDVGGNLSSPTVACGKVFVASIEDHRVVALDQKTGEVVWSYRANGRVDSPPTIYAGKAFFGCSDGWVYCVSSATGELIWSLRAAPHQRWIMSRGQVESAWPVHGSVLIEDDKAYFAAGRHADTDGGVLLYAVSPETGDILWQERIQANVINDILVSTGKTLFVQKLAFDPATGSRIQERVPFWGGTGGGFLTDPFNLIAGGHDLYRQWRHDDSLTRALTMAFAGESIFGIGIGLKTDPWKTKVFDSYEIFNCSRKAGPKEIFWQAAVPKGLLPKAILPAGGKVYVAAVHEEGGTRKGSILVHDATDGKSLGTLPLDVRPRFDGLAAVSGNLVVVGQDGKVICLSWD